jgi:hypothetical protein
MPETIHQTFAKSMIEHGYGHAFYDPQPTDEIQPGFCGWIDDNGIWKTIVNVTNDKDVEEKGYSKLSENIELMTPRDSHWGIKTSSSVTENEIEISASASAIPAGIPLDITSLWNYSHSSDFGAVLICPQEVTWCGFVDKAPFRAWAKANAELLLRNKKDALRQHGLFVVTATWSTTEAFTKYWINRTSTVKIGVKVEAPGVGGGGPKVSYHRASSAGSWNEADTKVGYYSSDISILILLFRLKLFRITGET